MGNNHAIEYLAIDLTGLMDPQKPKLRVPYPGPFWRGHEINIQFTAGVPVDAMPPSAQYIMDFGTQPKPGWFAHHFACTRNAQQIELHHEYGTTVIASYAGWLEFCEEWPKGDLEQ